MATKPQADDQNVIDQMPVTRGYDWDEYVPEDVPEYIPHNGEREEMLAEFETARESGKLPRAIVGGPTGSGKTHLARTVATDLHTPLLTIQGKYSMNEADLLGSPIIVNGETRWADGVLTKALLSSAERPTVLLVDEANRARPEAMSVLFSALDDRATVTLDARGGEVIQGDPHNLIVIATVNEGPGYFVEKMDLAERRRFGNKWYVDYLGLEHPAREAELLTSRTPAGSRLAELFVTAANDIRNRASDPGSAVGTGLPTATTMTWAQTAYAYAKAGMENPVMLAARNAVVNPFYSDDDEERDEVQQIITSHFDGAPFEDDEVTEWMDSSRVYVKCSDDTACGFSMVAGEYSTEHPNDADFDECPHCGAMVHYGSAKKLDL